LTLIEFRKRSGDCKPVTASSVRQSGLRFSNHMNFMTESRVSVLATLIWK